MAYQDSFAELWETYPLPWVVDDTRAGHEGLVTVFAANGRPVVCTGDMEGCSWADILNARLFAVAPELLAIVAALWAMRWQGPVYGGPGPWKLKDGISDKLLQQINAVIAKVHGTT